MTKAKTDNSNKAGRPTKYKAEYADQARKLCLLGAIDRDLADFFRVNEDTIHEWKKRHSEFSESIRSGKDLADAAVIESLFKRATGYSHGDVDIKAWQGEVILTPITKHYPPDTAAAIFWLKNRRKNEWRDKQEIDHTTKDQPIPLLAGIAPHGLVVEDDDGGTASADDSADKDQQS